MMGLILKGFVEEALSDLIGKGCGVRVCGYMSAGVVAKNASNPMRKSGSKAHRRDLIHFTERSDSPQQKYSGYQFKTGIKQIALSPEIFHQMVGCRPPYHLMAAHRENDEPFSVSRLELVANH